MVLLLLLLWFMVDCQMAVPVYYRSSGFERVRCADFLIVFLPVYRG